MIDDEGGAAAAGGGPTGPREGGDGQEHRIDQITALQDGVGMRSSRGLVLLVLLSSIAQGKARLTFYLLLFFCLLGCLISHVRQVRRKWIHWMLYGFNLDENQFDG